MPDRPRDGPFRKNYDRLENAGATVCHAQQAHAGSGKAHVGFDKAYSMVERPTPHSEVPCQVSSGSPAPRRRRLLVFSLFSLSLGLLISPEGLCCLLVRLSVVPCDPHVSAAGKTQSADTAQAPPTLPWLRLCRRDISVRRATHANWPTAFLSPRPGGAPTDLSAPPATTLRTRQDSQTTDQVPSP